MILMLMPDITAVLYDPTVGSRPFSILRRKGSWSGGHFVIDNTQTETISCKGCIQPAGEESLSQFPEGERREGRIVIYTTSTVYLTEGNEVSDEIEWQGEKYKVLSVTRWQEHGFNIAYATKR